MVVSAYCLHCTVCRKDFNGRSSWLRHLCQDEHQKVGRSKSLSCWWWGGGGGVDKEGMKECTLVIFCSFSLNDHPSLVNSLLEKLSRNGEDDGGNLLVTDFIWWPERDTVAYLQFESRKAVNQLFAGLVDPPNLQLDNKLVQLKKAVDIYKLELTALLPHHQSIEQIINTIITNGSTTTAPAIEINVPLTSSSSLDDLQSALQIQYNLICKSTQFPKEGIRHIFKIVNLIKRKFQEIHPSGQVVIFRNYYLHLKNSGTSTVLVYAYIADNPNDPEGYLPLNKETEELIFNCPSLQSRFRGCSCGGPLYRRKPPAVSGGGGDTRLSITEEGICYQNATSGFLLNFVTHPLAIVESQLSLLLQYLCTFDPHVKPLLTLVHFWARSNDVHLAEKNIPVCEAQSNCPEPVALEWLIILFLSGVEGLIPRVREILERPHKSLVVTDLRQDIGFSEDLQFSEKWRRQKSNGHQVDVTSEQFILEVVNLAQRFFQFYGNNLEEGCWVLNPKDGEILKRNGGHIGKSRLSKEETEFLAGVQGRTFTKPHLLISNFRIFILHPLFISWRLSFDVEMWTGSTCSKMKKTGEKLKEFLESGGPGNLASILSGSSEGHYREKPDGATGLSAVYSNPRFPMSSILKDAKTPVQIQFNYVCKAIEIPEDEFNYAMEIFKNVEQLFQKEYPSGQLIIFRNYYLRLRNTGTNTLLIYAFAGNPFDPTTFLKIPIDFQLDLPSDFCKKRSRGDIDGTTYYEHQVSKFRFHFVTFPLQIVEAHLSLMVQYLTTFDPKVKPVLSLIYFWARSHQIKIAEDDYPNFKYHSNCPEPVGLEWLVILFLSGEGIVPKVRKILERPHAPLFVGDNMNDIGFSMDAEYPKEWRRMRRLPVAGEVDVTSDQFVLEVVELTHKFFEFYGSNLEEGCWVANPKDGEIIKREGTRIGKCGMSKEEMETLAIVQGKETTWEHLRISDFRIFVLHPLYITWKLSFDVGRWTEVTCGKMRRMGEDLGRWLSGLKGGGGGGKGLSLEEVLAGGKEKSREVRLELTCEMNQNLRQAIRTKLEQRKRKNSERSLENGGCRGDDLTQKKKK